MRVENGNIRVLIATSAAGMGVNFKDIKYVLTMDPLDIWMDLSSSLVEQDVTGVLPWLFYSLMVNSVEN